MGVIMGVIGSAIKGPVETVHMLLLLNILLNNFNFSI